MRKQEKATARMGRSGNAMIRTLQNNTILRGGLTRTPGRLLTNQITRIKLHNDGVMTFNPSVTLPSELAGKFRIFWNPR